LTPNELVLTFGGLHVCVQFGENRRRNATGRVSTDGQTHAQTQNDFIICHMLYAIAMGQIIMKVTCILNVSLDIYFLLFFYDLRLQTSRGVGAIPSEEKDDG